MLSKITTYWVHAIADWIFHFQRLYGVETSVRLKEHIKNRIVHCFRLSGDLHDKRDQSEETK